LLLVILDGVDCECERSCSCFCSVQHAALFIKGVVMAETSRTERLVGRLREMQMNTPDVEAAAIVSVDGLTIASSLPGGVEEDRVSAMSAAMLSLGERIAGELGRGVLDEVYVKGERGYVILRAVGEEAVLTVLARQRAKLGLLFLDMRRASEELATILGA
jgi:predicted regulator of Ras-like GTPase activity (Roadblock/LC7/MglB family)